MVASRPGAKRIPCLAQWFCVIFCCDVFLHKGNDVFFFFLHRR